MKIASGRLPVLLCVLVVVAGCGSGGDGSGGSGGSGTATASPATSSSGASSTDSSGGGGSGGSGGGSSGGGNTGGDGSGGGDTGGHNTGGGGSGGDSGFAWVPFGPSNPSSPPPIRWYHTLEERRCETGGDSTAAYPLWKSVFALCEVVFGGDLSKWGAVKKVGGSGSCLDDQASRLVGRAVAWRDAHPGKLPVVTFPGTGSFACFTIRKVAVQEADGSLSNELKGPIGGNTTIVLTVDGLLGEDADTVEIGGTRVPGSEDSTNSTVTLATPAVDKPQKVTITLSNKSGTIRAPSPFTYVDATEPPAGAGEGGGGQAGGGQPGEGQAGGAGGDSNGADG